MTYKTGSWGIQARNRNKKRLEYFRKYQLVRMGLPLTHVSIGYIGEKEALIVLGGSKKLSRKIDLEWRGKKIDVKTSSLHKKVGWIGWKFWLKTQRGFCDFYLLICKNTDRNNSYLFLMPEKDVKKDQMVISLKKIKLFKKYQLKVR